MSIIPAVDKVTASRTAKEYLKQYKNWLLISFRQDKNHQEALYQCQERLKVIEHIKGDDLPSGIILECRFIKQLSVKRTLEELEQHNISIAERTLNYKQRQALLTAYEYMPNV